MVRIFINHISLELYISLTLQGYQKNAHMLKVVINSNFIIIFSHLASYTHILLTAFASCYLHISLIGQRLFADFQRFAEHSFTSCNCTRMQPTAFASCYLHSANKGGECIIQDAKNGILNQSFIFHQSVPLIT